IPWDAAAGQVCPQASLKALRLGEVAGAAGGFHVNRSRIGPLLTRRDAQERTLARTVDADQSDALRGVDGKGDALKQAARSIRFAYTRRLQERHDQSHPSRL